MSPEPVVLYDFRPVTEKDLPMIAGWLAEPHVAEWWDDSETEIAGIRENIDSISVEPLIVELGGRPIAYLQSYDPHLEDGHPYADQPFGTLGIDLSIGVPDLVGKGHGSAIARQFVEQLFGEGAPASSSIRIPTMAAPSAPIKRRASGLSIAGTLDMGTSC
jgi:aminoglycoside 6'-N-acetyltransferase